MTHQQLLQALDINPDQRGEGEMIYPLPDLTRAGIRQRLGYPKEAELGADGRMLLIYPIDGGRAMIAGYERDGVITRGMVYISMP
jgi:hypothetical protein